jgi:four helix bundle suffix protein
VEFVRAAEAEIAANAMVCAVNQAAYLLRWLLERQSRDFMEKGGFTESLYEARTKARAGNADAPECPLCGKPMRKRTAGKGTTAGKEFLAVRRIRSVGGRWRLSEGSVGQVGRG